MKKVFAYLLGVCGFACCDESDFGPQRLEYGCPHTDYTIKGIVTDGKNAVENEEILLQKGEWTVDTCKTDANGQFEITNRVAGDRQFCVNLIAKDLNDKYLTDTADVCFEPEDFTKKDTWLTSAEKTVNFTLKKKNGK